MKSKTRYACQSCGHSSAKWLGRCPSCGSWNSLVEERTDKAPGAAQGSLAAVRDEFRSLEAIGAQGPLSPGLGPAWVPLESEPEADRRDRKPDRRFSTGIGELDRVLGGGMVPDGFVLLGGDPGIGKSTLLLQMVKGILSARAGARILYVSGEESIEQIRDRARRLGVAGGDRAFLAAETQLERVFATVKELRPDVLVMDSLQTFSSGYLESAPGSVSQVREVAVRLMALAKSAGVAVWLVGHVTKEGSIAGPKTVEHMVDTVLYFEGEGGQSYRLLRTVKNRFGSTRELGVFEMEGDGLREVLNPSALFLTERREPVEGTAVTASLEGSRPLLVEVQALVAPASYGVGRRTAVGIESARVALIAAILEKHLRIDLSESDLYFNVAGGLKLTEPACDLAAAAAIWSSALSEPIPQGWVILGELGLTGEVRRVAQIESRLQEAKTLGFTGAIIPEQTPARALEQARRVGLRIERVGRIEGIAGPMGWGAERSRPRPRAQARDTAQRLAGQGEGRGQGLEPGLT